MPELPDVEMLKRYFDRTAMDQVIAAMDIIEPRILKGLAPAHLRSAVRGRRFEASRRHGKYLFAGLSGNGWMLFHFGMDGSFDFNCDRTGPGGDARAVIQFENGCRLIYCSWRMLGRIGWTGDVDAYLENLGIGPDALDPEFAFPAFRSAVQKKRSPIKTVLMDQHLIAGIGNVYADEILFQSRIHPSTASSGLNDAQLKKLFMTIGKVTRTAISHNADVQAFPGSYLLPNRHPKGRCPVCGSRLERITQGGRTGYYCPFHQRTAV